MNGDADNLVDKARVTSFSDNVISIALTLLVLDVRIPGPIVNLDLHDLRVQLLPRLMSFLLSFAIIGVYWVAHHIMFKVMRSPGRMILWLNNLFLLTISLIPASAALLGANVKSPIPTLLYGLNVAAVGTVMLIMWGYMVHRNRKLGHPVDLRLTVRAYARTVAGIAVALIGAGAGFYHPALSYGIYWLAPAAYILLQSAPHRLSETETI